MRKYELFITIKYRKKGLSWKEICINKLNYSDYYRVDKRGFKAGPYFFENLLGYPFEQLESETFSEIDLNQYSNWNDINFSELDYS